MIATRNFKPKEFECRCGCGLNAMSQNFINRLQYARDMKSILMPDNPTIRINCGCRCRKHNSELKNSVKDSAHVPDPEHGYPEVMASDIAFKDTRELIGLVAVLAVAGIRRFGFSLKDKYLHVDTDPRKPQSIWSY